MVKLSRVLTDLERARAAPESARSLAPVASVPPAPPKRRKREVIPGRWVAPGEPVEIAGYTIPDGMLYVGSILPDVRGYGVEPALIDPLKKVSPPTPKPAYMYAWYWPGYGYISPADRGQYLAWLAGGRRDPDVPRACVSLFFWGLERRLLLGKHDVMPGFDERERAALMAEVEQLGARYGAGSSIGHQVRSLLDFLGILADPHLVGRTPPPPPATMPVYYYAPIMSLNLRIGLGRIAASRQPLPAEWALAWAREEPSAKLRQPIWRAREQFAALFAQRYAER